MGRVIAFANQKGGVGKTTSAVNIAAQLGIQKKKTLLVDFDPQGNATSGVGITRKSGVATAYDVMAGKAKIKNAIIKTEYDNLYVLPSNMALAAAEFELAELSNRTYVLKEVLEEVRNSYDFIIIDCPPSLGMLTMNALTASDGVIIPMQCEYFALEGLTQILLTTKQVKKNYNPKLEFLGIIITMYNGRLNLSLSVIDELKKHYADKIFKTPVTRNVKLSEAPSYGMPIQYYDKFAKGTEDYRDITKELLERI